jgi:hypothetical protein
MKLKWTAIVVAFVVAFVMGIFGGLYLPKNVSLIGPIIGGLIAGYLVGGNYTDGLVNGGIPAGLAGLISLPVVLSLSWSEITTAVSNLGYQLPQGSFIMIIIGSAFAGFAIYFVLGIIGAIIGVAVKKRISS